MQEGKYKQDHMQDIITLAEENVLNVPGINNNCKDV